jgi:hypothetical protein
VQYYFQIANYGTNTGYYTTIRSVSTTGYGLYSWDGPTNTSIYTGNTAPRGALHWNQDLGYVLSGSVRTVRYAPRAIGNDDNILSHSRCGTNGIASVNIRYNKQGPYFNDAELYCSLCGP